MWFYKPRGQWVAEVRHPETGARIRWYLGPDERQATIEYHRRMAALYGEQMPQPPAVISLAELAERYLAWCEANCARSTVQFRKCYLAWLLEHEEGSQLMGRTAAHALRLYTVEAIKAAKRKTNTPRSVNAFVATVRAMYRWAVATQLLATNPVAAIKGIPREPQRKKALSTTQVDTLLTVGDKHPPMGDFCRVLLYEGLRLGELAGLPWSAYDEPKGTLTIYHHKTVRWTGRPKTVLVCDATAQVLARQPRSEGDLPIFPVTAVALYQRLRRAQKRTPELVGVTFHALRHTCATRMLESGIPLHIARERLGHESSLMTLYYTDASPALLRAAGQAVAEGSTNTAPPSR